MTAREYKAVKAEAQRYIDEGFPIAAAHVMEQWELKLSFKQYFELSDLIHNALEGKGTK